jgi:hypothetical protein
LVLAGTSVNAQTYTSGDWEYVIANEEVTITRHIGSGGSVPLGAVTFPNSLDGMPVKKIGNGGSVFSYDIINGNSAIRGITDTTVTSVTIPSGITYIGAYSFGGLVNLTSVIIPNSVISFGAGAFANCTGLTSIIIPNSVTSIGGWAFSSCIGLTSIIIPNSVTSIGDGAFLDCAGLTSIIIPNSVTSIGDSAFAYCTGLTSITIPNSVTSIGSQAFANCTGLTTLLIGSGITSIREGAFEGCSGLTTLTIPNSVTSIDMRAFQNCYALTSITIPESVTSIAQGVFAGCTSLTSITMPDRFISQVSVLGISGQVATDYIINALANNDAFVTAVANKIKGTSGNYGIATQSGVTSSISSVINEGRIAGVASVTASPNTWSLFTTSQIQNMAVGDLVLTRQVSGGFVLNYDIEQSTDLQTWTTYAPLSLPLTGLPADKAFVRIKAKQNGSGSQSAPTSSTPTTDINNGANWNSQQNTMGSPVEGAPGT